MYLNYFQYKWKTIQYKCDPEESEKPSNYMSDFQKRFMNEIQILSRMDGILSVLETGAVTLGMKSWKNANTIQYWACPNSDIRIFQKSKSKT